MKTSNGVSKNNSESLFVVNIIVIVLAVSAIGYFLIKNPPNNASKGAEQEASMHNHDLGLPMAANTKALNALVGKPMPDIQLTDKDGKTYTVADFKGKNTVLFFSEGLMCYPACWNQMAGFGSDARFNSGDIQAISVVVDSASDWEKAIAQMPELAKATTMFDADANASRKLGMLTTESSMHRGALPGHTYVILSKDGVVTYVFDDPNMAMANDMLLAKIGAMK